MTTATHKANELATKLKATGKFPRVKVWSSDFKNEARVYTGHAGEFLAINETLAVSKSKTNLTWGHIIRDVLDGE